MSKLIAETEEQQKQISKILGSNSCVYQKGVILDRLITYEDMAAIVDYLRSQQVVTSIGNMQVGGNHYQQAIQPVEYIHANNLPFIEGNVVKYVTRHKLKDGAKDVAKAMSYCKMLLKLDYGYTDEQIKELYGRDV